MNILSMNHDMLDSIRLLDRDCFNLGNFCRTKENLTELININPDGCFVATLGNEIVGYLFSRVMGNAGFIGPVGVRPDMQSRGIGKAIVKAGCVALKNGGCTAIGLEVLPDSSRNIGLYQKLGFVFGFSTIAYRKNESYVFYESKQVVNGKEIDFGHIRAFDKVLREEQNGYSLIRDIELALSHSGSSIFFFKENDFMVGFLCYSPIISPYVWGAFLKRSNQKFIFEALFSYIEKATQKRELIIRINSRYKNAVSMIDSSFKVDKCLVRMMLDGYFGEFMSLDTKSFVAHSWVG